MEYDSFQHKRLLELVSENKMKEIIDLFKTIFIPSIRKETFIKYGLEFIEKENYAENWNTARERINNLIGYENDNKKIY